MWRPITTSSLSTVLSSAEYTTFTNTLTGSYTATQIVNDQISQITAFVRTCVASSNKNEVDIDETLLPESLHYPTLTILAIRLGERLGGIKVDINGSREKAYDRAMEHLDKVTTGQIAIEKPLRPLTPWVEKDTCHARTDNTPLEW